MECANLSALKAERVISAAGVNCINLRNGNTTTYTDYGISRKLLTIVEAWLYDALSANGKPVLIPGTLPLQLLNQEFSLETLEKFDQYGYMNFYGIALNIGGALFVTILNPLKMPLLSMAFSEESCPAFWQDNVEKMGAAQYAEPPAPWAAEMFHERASFCYEGSMLWLVKMKFALASLYMDVHERFRRGE